MCKNTIATSGKRIMRSTPIPRRFLAALLGTLLGLLSISTASAGVIFSGSNGILASKAIFEISGTNLLVTLSNTATADAFKQTDILTAVFFDLTTDDSLTLEKATVGASDFGIYQQDAGKKENGNLNRYLVRDLAAPGSTNGGPGSFNGGWQYREDLSGLKGLNQTRGVGTNGLGIFNGKNVMDSDNEDYGLTSIADNVATSQSKQLFNFPLIKNSIVFTFSGLTPGFDPTAMTVSNVRFQYGTDLKTTSLIGFAVPGDGAVPEPSTLAIWSIIAIGCCGGIRRHRKSA